MLSITRWNAVSLLTGVVAIGAIGSAVAHTTRKALTHLQLYTVSFES
jgi:hypothetical protein